jgi:hypothetical protein
MKRAKTFEVGKVRAGYKRAEELVRGKYGERLQQSSNVVVLDPELVALFANAAAVNAALRSLAENANRAEARRGRSR